MNILPMHLINQNVNSTLAIAVFASVLASLLAGSVINMLTYRLPIMLADINSKLNLFTPRSHCPSCQKSLQIRQLIPIFSYLYYRGKCKYCRTAIGKSYIYTELLCVAIGAAITIATKQFNLPLLLCTWICIGLAIIDAKHQWLPDSLTLSGCWLGLTCNALQWQWNWSGAPTLASAVIGASAGYLLIRLIDETYTLIRQRPGIGRGDAKLLALFGAWLGWYPMLLTLMLGVILCLIFSLVLVFRGLHKYDQPIAFGPFLTIAGGLVLCFSSKLPIII